MSKNINNIDDLLRDSFEDFSSAPSPDIRAKLSAKLRYFNFFKFNPGSFNIFYLTAIILGTTATIVFSIGPQEIKDNPIKPIETEKIINITPEKNCNTIEGINITSDFSKNSITNEISIDNPKSIISETNSSENSTESPENVFLNDTFINQTEKNDTGNSEVIEKNVIFDTIINPEKIIITDTVKTEIHKTVEVKNKKNKK
ncbi:MAG TPA: hypothetical protein PKN32_05745 [Bacteroidales bacterium]|nr:hypothetical protein [Bacteroidales bacterium]